MMFTLINFLPWYFWLLFGIVGSAYLIKWVIKSKDDPMLLRMSWILMSLLAICISIENLSKGMGWYLEYLRILYKIEIVISVLMAPLMFVGGYRKVMRPGYNLEKRRIFIFGMYLMGGACILMGMVVLIIFYK